VIRSHGFHLATMWSLRCELCARVAIRDTLSVMSGENWWQLRRVLPLLGYVDLGRSFGDKI
jgi:hypothetical protein